MDNEIIEVGMLAVPTLLLLGQIRILNDKNSWLVLSGVATTLSAVALIGFLNSWLSEVEAIMLTAPLYQLVLYRVAYSFFVYRFKRDPENVSFVWKHGLVMDRIFSFSYFMIAVFSVIAVIGLTS